jgi:hypothetical protein
MSRIDDVMEADDSSEPGSIESGADRVKSIMDSDYEQKDESIEPEDKKIMDDQTPSSKPEDKKEKKEPKSDKKDEKEDEEKGEKEDKEEEKKEEEKKADEKKKYKYKVDGVEIEEELSDEEVASAISGRKAIQKRFLEIDKEKKSVQKERETFNKDFEYVKSELGTLRSSFEDVISDFTKTGQVNKNPVDGVYNLLDKMGLDTKEYDKALFFHFIPEVAKFMDMDENGREAYLLKKENGWLQKGRDKLAEKEHQANEYRSKLESENSLKRQAGLSEESFTELKEELETKHGLQNLTTEQVVQWNSERPFYNRAEAIAEKVPGVDVIKVAKILLEFPETTDEWMLEQFGYKQILEKKAMSELKGKIPPKPSAKKVTSEDTEEDEEFFKQFRRR